MFQVHTHTHYHISAHTQAQTNTLLHAFGIINESH